jgi:NADH-quinone oxidoreductase subunit N
VSGVLSTPWAPHIAMGTGAVLLLALEAACWPRRRSSAPGYLALLVCLLALSLVLADGGAGSPWAAAGMVADIHGDVLGAAVLFGTALVILLSIQRQRGQDTPRSEQYPFILLASLGAMVLVAATDLLLAAVALALCWVGLTAASGADRPGPRAAEATIKMLLAGALSTSLALYAAVLCYGVAGTTEMSALATATIHGVDADRLSALVAPMFMGALAIAMAAMPFHMWAPDTAQGSASPVAAACGFIPRLAALALMGRLASSAADTWLVWLGILGAVSALGGYLLATGQRDLSRLLGYVGIAQGGMAMVATSMGSAEGHAAAIVHQIAFVLALIGSYAVVEIARPAGSGEVGASMLRGLARTRPVLAAVLAVCMISLAGWPLTGGFVGRLGLFAAVVEAGAMHLAVALAAALVVAVYVHLRLIGQLFLACCPEPQQVTPCFAEGAAVLLIAVAAVIGIGLWPGPILDAAQAAAAAL